MEIYDLERQFKHQFYYVERVQDSFNYETGDQSSKAIPVLCRGVAFSSKDDRFKETIARVQGIGEQPFNDWIFMLRSKWVSSVSYSSFFVYDGLMYEIMDYDTASDGFVIKARTTRKPMTIVSETATVTLTETTEVTHG